MKTLPTPPALRSTWDISAGVKPMAMYKRDVRRQRIRKAVFRLLADSLLFVGAGLMWTYDILLILDLPRPL